MFKKKILVIDDSVLILEMISDILRAENYDVIIAKSGEEGLEKVATEKPDLVLLDVVLPIIDGFEVCRILRADESNNLMPIIMLTSQCSEDDKLTGLELGADDYIIKPFNPRELISRVRNTLVRIERNRLVNPLTGLPGNIEIQMEVNHRIATDKLFALIYADLDNFKAYNDAYGFANGDRAIKLTADVIYNSVHLYGTSDDFLGHVGGDDFIIVTIPVCADNICKSIIDDFDKGIKSLYNESDIKKGYIATVDRRGKINRLPIMSISMAVVSNEYRKFKTYAYVSEVASEVKNIVKSIPESAYFKDRRKC
jgi:diguanylate cyclase (GGDEF)-like protein